MHESCASKFGADERSLEGTYMPLFRRQHDFKANDAILCVLKGERSVNSVFKKKGDVSILQISLILHA